MSRFAKRSAQPPRPLRAYVPPLAPAEQATPVRRPRRGPSVYENRAKHAATRTTIVATSGPMAGRALSYEANGEFVKAEPCCDSPARCQRTECWTPIGELR